MEVNVRQLRQGVKQVLDAADNGEVIRIVRGKSVYTLALDPTEEKRVHIRKKDLVSKAKVTVNVKESEPIEPDKDFICEHGKEYKHCMVSWCVNRIND